MIGRSLQDAVSAVQGANLRLIYVKFPVTSRAQAGKIVQQSPLGGGEAPRERAGARLPRRLPRTGDYQPRRSSSSLGSSDCVEMPTIASPRPAETRASTSASM